jgi:hypothetical protein
MRERSVSFVPKSVVLLLLAALALQIGWHRTTPAPQAKAENLEAPATLTTLRIASLSEPVALGKLLMLYVQAFDNQPGVRLPFQSLDYNNLQQWLGRILELDPKAQYPLLAATHLYAEVPDDAKKRVMLDFVYRSFLEDPNHRWRAMTHAAFIARHRLKDLPLTLKYARAIRLYATDKNIPSWARQMEIFLLEDMNELDSARILLGGLLASGEISDPQELRFLDERLKQMNQTTPAK